MSRLRVFSEADPVTPLSIDNDHAAISRKLADAGVRFERWQASKPVQPGASQEEVIAAYRADIDRLMRNEGYGSVDVVSMNQDHPDTTAIRAKFLDEHTHSENEVRFFVAGSGLFTLHIAPKVYEITCVQGDLLDVPDGTPHWFDMGPLPSFVAIRLFTSTAGWVAKFTGSDIAGRFPRYDRDPSV